MTYGTLTSSQKRKLKEKQDRVKSILNAAEKILLSKGLESVTIDKIAEKCMLSKGTLYLYFKNKDEILASLTLKITNIFLAQLKQVPQQKTGELQLKKILEAYYHFMKENFQHSKLRTHFITHIQDKKIYTGETINGIRIKNNEIIEIIHSAIKQGMQDGSFRKDINSYESMHLIEIINLAFLSKTLEKDYQERLKEEFNIELDAFIKNYFLYVTHILK